MCNKEMGRNECWWKQRTVRFDSHITSSGDKRRVINKVRLILAGIEWGIVEDRWGIHEKLWLKMWVEFEGGAEKSGRRGRIGWNGEKSQEVGTERASRWRQQRITAEGLCGGENEGDKRSVGVTGVMVRKTGIE